MAAAQFVVCFDYHIDGWLQNCMVHCVLRIIGCVMSDACHAEQEYPYDDCCRKRLFEEMLDNCWVPPALVILHYRHIFLLPPRNFTRGNLFSWPLYNTVAVAAILNVAYGGNHCTSGFFPRIQHKSPLWFPLETSLALSQLTVYYAVWLLLFFRALGQSIYQGVLQPYIWMSTLSHWVSLRLAIALKICWMIRNLYNQVCYLL